jgi:hypothetical protein
MDREHMTALADRFDRFAQIECGASPLYLRLSQGIAADQDLLALAAHAQPGQPAPNLLLAAVHSLLLRGVPHPLAGAYPSVNSLAPALADPFPHFRALCLEQAEAIRALLHSRRVQTNEVARSALLLPAFQRVAAQALGQPLFLIEVGCSAGLLLQWDRYQYDFGTGTVYGASNSALRLSCAPKGTKVPPLTESVPAVAGRIGIDMVPVDLSDPEAVLWLRALVWPDQPARLQRLERAIGVAQEERVTLLSGDALDLLPNVVQGAPPGAAVCVFHCHTLNQFSASDRQRFYDLLSSLSVEREIHHLSIEAKGGHPQMERARFERGIRVEHELLANCHGHGEWIEWLA